MIKHDFLPGGCLVRKKTQRRIVLIKHSQPCYIFKAGSQANLTNTASYMPNATSCGRNNYYFQWSGLSVFQIGWLRAWDGTGQQNSFGFRPGNLGATVIAKDGGPYNVRKIGIWDYGELRGLPGKAFGAAQQHNVLGRSRDMSKKKRE